MSITATWDDENKTIIRQVFEGRWTWAEFDAAWAQVETMGEGLKDRVDFIIDMRKSSLLPGDALQRATKVNDAPPDPRVGMTVVVGANFLIRAFWNTFQRALGRVSPNLRLSFAGSLDEARTMIAEDRRKKAGPS